MLLLSLSQQPLEEMSLSIRFIRWTADQHETALLWADWAELPGMNSNEGPLPAANPATSGCTDPRTYGDPWWRAKRCRQLQWWFISPSWKQTLISWGDWARLCDLQPLKQSSNCPISSFNKLLMKEIKISSLTSALLFILRLHKYISVTLSKCTGSRCFHFIFL